MDKNKNYVGIILDNNDPKRLGRCKIMVVGVFDSLPVNDIPWATPWKDPNGNQFILPDKGKVVNVRFDLDNIYKPEYIYSESYNINLENKLKNLSEESYLSMKSVLFDHKTQIFSNDSEGLIIDYKFNKINIKEDQINLCLKDNFSKVNIGSSTANQQSILGNYFLDWLEEFLNILISKDGPSLITQNGPVSPTPSLIDSVLKFRTMKDPKFLSHHVNIVDNNYVDTYSDTQSTEELRVNISQIGDSWKSTKSDLKNNLVSKEVIDYSPKGGNVDDISSDKNGSSLTVETDDSGELIPNEPNIEPEIISSENPDIEAIIRTMRRKGYRIFERPYEVNIIGIRKRYEGDKYSNSFDDDLFVIYKDDTSKWISKKFKISTMPGYYKAIEIETNSGGNKKISLQREGYKLKSNQVFAGNTKDGKAIDIKLTSIMLSRGGMGILMESQYIDVYTIGNWMGDAMKTRGKQKFYRDTTEGNIIKYTKRGEGSVGMFIHKGFPGGRSVFNWSEGCQVFSSKSEMDEFYKICRIHEKRYGNKFSYTLMLERDIS